jgi:AraC-like DNA-binding protein
MPLTIVDCGTQKITQTETFCWPFHQFVCCSQGEGIVIVDKKEFRLTPGSVFYMKPNVEHEYFSSKVGYHVSWVSFNGFLMNSLSVLYGLSPQSSSTAIQDRLYPDIHLRVMSILEDMESSFVMDRSSVTLYGIIVEFFLQYKYNHFLNQKSQYQLVEQAVKAMKSSIHGILEISALADDLGVTRQHLSRLFRKRYNMTSKEYYIRLKVLQSKKDILQFPDSSIKHIAERLGFINASHFTRVFHSIAGIAPMEFRKTYQNRHFLDDSDYYEVDVIEDT